MFIRKTIKKEGVSLERQIESMLIKGEKVVNLESKAPLIYTPKKDGVLAAYDPRTDRFEIGLNALINEQQAKERMLIAKELQGLETAETQLKSKPDTNKVEKAESTTPEVKTE